MQKTLLFILALAISSASFAQVKSRVEKRNGIWFLIEESPLSDTSQIPDPVKIPPVVIDPEIPGPIKFPGPTIHVLPGQSIAQAVARATAGTWVIVSAGTYNEPNFIVAPGVNIWGMGEVIINASTSGGYAINGENGTTALIALSSSSKTPGNQRIHNLKLRGFAGKGVGGIMVNQRSNVVITRVDIENFNFSGLWIMYSDNIVVSGARLHNNSYCNTNWASGEFNYVEVNNCLFRDIVTTSSSPSRGYGFKVLWSGRKNVYNVTFRKIETRMHHSSNWQAGKSNNIGFEMHDVRVQGKILVDSSYFENQISIVLPEANPTEVIFQNGRHDGKNDRYTFETWLDNFKVINFTSTNSSQFSFNVETTRVVKNWLLQNVKYSRGTAPDLGWSATFLFGSGGQQNIVLQGSTFSPLTYKPNQNGIIVR
jgi:hypothetical protein